MLKATAIDKSFFGNKVLDNVDFEVQAGEVHALIGENGAGKSTLVNILSGNLSRDEGIVHYDGQEVTVWPPTGGDERRDQCGASGTLDRAPSHGRREHLSQARNNHSFRFE